MIVEVTTRQSRALWKPDMTDGRAWHPSGAHIRTQMSGSVCWGTFSAVSSDLLPFEVEVCATSRLSGCQLRAPLCVSGARRRSLSICDMMETGYLSAN